MKNKIYLIILFFVTLIFAFKSVIAQQQIFPLPSVNGKVNSIVEDSNRVYVGGNFTEVGVGVNNNVMCDTSAQAQIIFDSLTIGLNGNINAVISDGIGGYFIGGTFITTSGNRNLIHVDVNKIAYANFHPNPKSAVYALFLSTDTLYVGGDFDSISNSALYKLCAINANSGMAYNFMPTVGSIDYNGSEVKDFERVGDTLYFGGTFDIVNNNFQQGLGAIKISTGQIIPMPFSTSGDVNEIEYNPVDKRIYTCGILNGIGTKKNCMIELNAQTGALNSNFPDFPGLYIKTSISDGIGGWYVGGSFTINSNIKNLIHVLNTNKLDTAFHPNPNDMVYCLSIVNNILFLGGEFDSIGGVQRKYIASVNKNTGVLNNWDANCDNFVKAIFAKDSLLFLSGSFNSIANKRIPNFAILNINTFQVYNDYNFSNSASCFTADSNSLFVGGYFHFFGKSINGVAALTTTNTVPDKNISLLLSNNFTKYNNVLSVVGDGVGGWYIGGLFSTKQGLKNLIHIDANKTLDTIFKPNPDNWVTDIHLVGNTLF